MLVCYRENGTFSFNDGNILSPKIKRENSIAMLRQANIRKQLRPNRTGMVQLFDSYFQIIGARHIGKRRIVAMLLFLSASAAMLAVSGCKGSGVVTVNSVTISPSSATVALGAQTNFTATVNLSNSSNTNIANSVGVT